jgi:1L-myo-inositol 1-phosphate cytidylyltransferase / CDP-L-myo-inositol myo-inositolphosphotransferase
MAVVTWQPHHCYEMFIWRSQEKPNCQDPRKYYGQWVHRSHPDATVQNISNFQDTHLMSKPQDGFVSRFLNRPISCRITRFLLKFPVHPNAWTISIFVLPLIACVFLVRGDYISVVIGAAIFQAFSILDGCDGEIARAKNLESKFGERLDYFCDFLASLLYVLALGLGLRHTGEGVVCASLIIANEWLLRGDKSSILAASSRLHASFYRRHGGMISHSGLLRLGERAVWWVFQLTKRDMALFVFLMLALLGLGQWILRLWTIVAAASVTLSAIAAIRSGVADGDVVAQEPRS